MPDANPWRFFAESYDTERLKTLSVWSAFRDSDLRFRCAERARTPLEHMVHQCVSEDTWMRTMPGLEIPLTSCPSVSGSAWRVGTSSRQKPMSV